MKEILRGYAQDDISRSGLRVHLRRLVLLGGVACLPLLGSSCHRGDSVLAIPPDHLPRIHSATSRVTGRMVCDRNREGKNIGIYLLEVSTRPEFRRVTPSGDYARWSPDGEWIAFRRGNDLLRVRPNGTEEEKLASFSGFKALAWRPDGSEIWCADAGGVHAVVMGDRSVRQVMAQKAVELDVSADGLRVVYSLTDHYMYGADLAAGTSWQIGRGCSASLSPDGTRVTNNRGDHKSLWLRDWRNGQQSGTIKTPGGTTFDNQWWSNLDDWMVSRTEQPRNQDIWLHHIPDDQHWKLTFTGDCDRPDFFVPPTPPPSLPSR